MKNYNEIWKNEPSNGKYGKWWGGDNDIAADVEWIYEQKYGKSAVLWEKENGEGTVETLPDRPEEYSTCGYSSDFEGWGQKIVVDAIDFGCDTYESIYDFFKKHG